MDMIKIRGITVEESKAKALKWARHNWSVFKSMDYPQLVSTLPRQYETTIQTKDIVECPNCEAIYDLDTARPECDILSDGTVVCRDCYVDGKRVICEEMY